jgi:uncharacterized protein with PIN domain
MNKNKAYFRFYEELNDFLPPHRVKRRFPYEFRGSPSVKDAIEAMGVPHTEVELILANGTSVGFDYNLKDNDSISVYPVFETIDITPIVKVRKRTLRHGAFILDVHLGKLARMLRMLGFDVLYRNNYRDSEIIELALREKRIILTRDRRLLHAKVIDHGYWVRATNPDKQLVEVIQRFDLGSQIKPFHRCLVCNGEIVEVDKGDVLERLEPKTIRYYDRFYICTSCSKVYWQGSHYERMREKLVNILEAGASSICAEKQTPKMGEA